MIFSNEVCNTFTAMSSWTLLSDHIFAYQPIPFPYKFWTHWIFYIKFGEIVPHPRRLPHWRDDKRLRAACARLQQSWRVTVILVSIIFHLIKRPWPLDILGSDIRNNLLSKCRPKLHRISYEIKVPFLADACGTDSWRNMLKSEINFLSVMQ
jgi:hypothetical protein